MATTRSQTGLPEPLPTLDPQFIQNVLSSSGDPRIESWKLLVRAIDQSALIHRFSDKAQSSFTGALLPDGSNLDTRTLIPGKGIKANGSFSLQQAFNYYRQWLTWLHYKELLIVFITNNRHYAATDFDDTRISQELMVNMVHETELQKGIQERKVVEREGTFNQRDDLMWVYDWRRGVHDGINAMQHASEQASLEGLNVSEAIHEAWEQIPLEIKVLAVLSDQEERFEKSLRVKHVEDTLLTKRIWILSDKSVAWLTRPIAQEIENRYTHMVFENVKEIGKRSRDVFDFRLLRDWGYGRPWKKLYLVVKTEDDPELAATIEILTGLFASSKLSSDLMGVHPIDKADLPEDELCVICQCEFEPEEMLLKTWCDHKFHPGCIFESWDQDYKFDFICPLCRHSPGEVRDRIVFDAEKKDFKGDADETHAEENRLDYAWDWDLEHPDQDMPMAFSVALARYDRLEDERLGRERDQRAGRGVLPGL